MSHQIHGDDRDYPVIDRVHDEEPDDPTRRGPDGTEADADAEAEYHAGRPDDGTTILPVEPPYDGTGTGRDDDRDGDGVPDVEDADVVDLRDTDGDRDSDGEPAHRADAPVDAVPGEADQAGPGDPLPGDGLADDRVESPRTGDSTVIAVDDVAAQDPGVVVVPPVTDDMDAVPPATDPGATPGPAAEVVPVPVPVETGSTVDDRTTGPGAGSDDRWRELQLTFVDDPSAAVREAADLLERAIADLRQQYEGSDSTEDLRTAFRRYRDVYRSLTG
jgi:hypothetical protein